ncbi:uncharacterized protein LOC130381790 isoform X4 [Gadus chalcogrammus]|uniref:uncharacterized protein LOC130381790 isoform X4 n=1 Tax=Gadus chalcogrammus TaxID=1042646 RepID=UPI0024C27017|nr:uncharacterized protein LOC130381790 isoform X4 [Gadus chalcogrammus]
MHVVAVTNYSNQALLFCTCRASPELLAMARFFNVLLAYVGLAVVQSDLKSRPTSRTDGLPYHYRGQWILPNDGHPYGEQSEEDSLEARTTWPAVMQTAALVVTEQEAPQLETKQEPRDLEEQDDVEDSTWWKGLVLAAVLLVSAMATLSVVYYLCVWRGGRIYYQPQHDLSSGM